MKRKKSLAIATSFIFLFSAFSPVLAESQKSISLPVTQSVERIATTTASTTSQHVQPAEEFFFPTPLPAGVNKYIVPDVEGHWAAPFLQNFIYADILKGYEVQPGKYEAKPDNNITRAEFVTLLVRTLHLTSSNSGKSFADVPSGIWYEDSVRIASSLGIVNGIDATHFGPDMNIKRSEIAAMIMRAFGNTLEQNGGTKYFTDVAADHWAKTFIDSAVKAKVINGYPDGTFLPEANATRAEGVKMLYAGLIGQKSDLPTDVEVAKVFVDLENGKLLANFDQDYAKTAALADKYTFGLQNMNEKFRLAQYQQILNKGYQLSFGIEGTSYEILIKEKANSIAILEVSNVTQKVYKLKKGSVVGTLNEPINNTVCLRKMADGQWKIYYNIPDL